MTMYTFRIINEIDWNEIEDCFESTIFHSKEWNIYLKKSKFYPIVIEIFQDNDKIGFFVGHKKWLGIKCLGAPLEGTGTYTQGLCLKKSIGEDERVNLYKKLADWLLNNRIASFIQISDWSIRKEDQSYIDPKSLNFDSLQSHNISYVVRPTLFLDLRQNEQELWSNLHYKSCKYCINKANKLGLKVHFIDSVDQIDDFVENHYNQLVDVCDRHGMKPKSSQSKKKMSDLCHTLFPNRVLMAEVIGSDENNQTQIMSSGIFCYDKGESIYWTGASYRQYMKYNPNELMVWEAMKELHKRAAGDLNFGGMADYKLKFGTKYAYVPKFFFYHNPLFYKSKEMAIKTYGKIKRIKAYFSNKIKTIHW